MGKTLSKLLAGAAIGALALSPVAHATVTASIVGAENTATFDNNPIGAMSGNSFVRFGLLRRHLVHGYRRGGR